jgi:hypothetical protein
MRATAIDLGRNSINDLHRIAHILDFTLNAILDAAVLALKEILVVNSFVIVESLDLLVDDLVLEALHLRQQTLDTT